jgi:hypothetical protein
LILFCAWWCRLKRGSRTAEVVPTDRAPPWSSAHGGEGPFASLTLRSRWKNAAECNTVQEQEMGHGGEGLGWRIGSLTGSPCLPAQFQRTLAKRQCKASVRRTADVHL